jgi:hypothetical protein
MSPTVGLKPTMPQALAGLMMEPFVSVPIAAGASPAATAAAEPELEPLALCVSLCGLRVRPPRALQPLVEFGERMFAHSLRLVLPRMSAPASRNRVTSAASCFGLQSRKASEPAVVCIASAVSMLSLIRMGRPCNRPGFATVRTASHIGIQFEDGVQSRP